MNFVGDRDVWSPSVKFIFSGKDLFIDEDLVCYEIAWDIKRIYDANQMIFVCIMSGFGLESTGVGHSFHSFTAIKKAFAESWERLWMKRLNYFSSNGFASGETDEDAINRAKAELIERAIVLKAWQTMKGWCSYRPFGFKVFFVNSLLRLQKWNVRFYILKNQKLGEVVCFVGFHPAYGTVFDSLYIANKSECFYKEEILSRLLRQISLAKSREKVSDDFIVGKDGSPEDHHRYYAVTQNVKAFDFLNSKQDVKNIVLRGVEKIEVKLVAKKSIFPAVAVAQNSAWPELSWGTNSITGENQWLHPIA